MNSPTDCELLRGYVKDHTESSFTELVRRHVNLVYSAALRETNGDTAEAQDISQGVFSELARKASRLQKHPALAGWLYTCVRRFASNLRRANQRRSRREQEAHAMNEHHLSDSHESLWLQIRPVLDSAMHELGEKDRAAVVLRFFEDQSLREVGLALELNENAARMRVDRALEKLRVLLAKRGVTSTASGVAAALSVGAVVSAPPTLAATVAGTALTGAPALTYNTFTLLKIMSMTKLKVGVVSALIMAAVVVPVWQGARLRQTTAENRQLRAQSAELQALRDETAGLRELQVDHAELERLRAAQAQLQAEMARLRGRIGAAQRLEAEAAQFKAALGGQAENPSANAKSNQLSAAVQDMVKGAVEQQALGQLARMKTKLNLGLDQEQAIRTILLKHTEESLDAAQKMFGDKVSREELAALGKVVGYPEEEIKAILSPEQQAAYQEFKQEQVAANARVAANAELLQVQDVLGLNLEQQDKMFAVLYDQHLRQLEGKGSGSVQPDANPASQMDRYVSERVKALEGVLKPDQLESYRQMLEKQISVLKKLAR